MNPINSGFSGNGGFEEEPTPISQELAALNQSLPKSTSSWVKKTFAYLKNNAIQTVCLLGVAVGAGILSYSSNQNKNLVLKQITDLEENLRREINLQFENVDTRLNYLEKEVIQLREGLRDLEQDVSKVSSEVGYIKGSVNVREDNTN